MTTKVTAGQREIHSGKPMGAESAATCEGKRGFCRVVSAVKSKLQRCPVATIFRTLKGRISESKIKSRQNLFLYFLQAKIDLSKKSAADIREAVKYCIHLSKTDEATEGEREQIRTFFQKLSALDEKQFDRKKLLGGEVALQRILSPELDDLLDQVEWSPELENDSSHKLKIAVAKAQLSVALGYGIEQTPNGLNGAVFVKSLEGKKIGVFKAPKDTKWYDLTSVAKSHFGQMRLLNKKDALAQEYAEVAAYQLSQRLGFNIAPEASLAEIKGKEGAFLGFLDGYDVLSQHVQALQARSSFTEHEKTIWQIMSLFNFLTGNMDPHADNVFVKVDKQGKLQEIRMIDAGNSFIEHNPGRWGSTGNQGAWGQYKIAESKFTEEALAFIRTNLTKENLDAFLSHVQGERATFMSPEMRALMEDRLQIFRECILERGMIENPQQLSKIHTKEDYDAYFEKMRATPKISSKEEGLEDFVIIDVK